MFAISVIHKLCLGHEESFLFYTALLLLKQSEISISHGKVLGIAFLTRTDTDGGNKQSPLINCQCSSGAKHVIKKAGTEGSFSSGSQGAC